MFEKILDKFTDDDGDIYEIYGVTAVCILILSIVTAIITLLMWCAHIRQDSEFHMGVYHLMLVSTVPIAIPLMLVALDGVITDFVDFVQDGDVVCKNFLMSKLYGTPEYGWNTNRLVSACVITALMLFAPLITLYMFIYVPIVGIILLSTFGIVATVCGFALLSRSAVRLSKKLNGHIADPDAHTTLKD